ncbi:MAG: DUF1343 domain-containing protein [Verrucomicrobiota bacterium]
MLRLTADAEVMPGIDVLKEKDFQGLLYKNVGLVTNPSAVTREGKSTLEVLFQEKRIHLNALFGPEHGVYGSVPAGKYIQSFRESNTGIWVHSLYGETRAPSPRMMKGLDVVVYDMQDIGCRSYTYISTLGLVMQEAANQGIEVMVLDRPNPMGGNRIEGPRLSPAYKSFVGQYDIPYVYGLTIGELAQWINVKFLTKPCKLTVVPMKGWYREMVWEETGLKWISSSPNIPTIKSARGYLATSILGDVGVDTGVGEKFPFQVAAHEGWNGASMARKLNAHKISGIQAGPFQFRSKKGRWAGVLYEGVAIDIDPKAKGSLASYGFHVLEVIREETPSWKGLARANKESREMFDKLNGSSSYRVMFLNGKSASEIQESWGPGLARWVEERKPYLLYKNLPAPPPEPAVMTSKPLTSTNNPTAKKKESPEGTNNIPVMTAPKAFVPKPSLRP